MTLEQLRIFVAVAECEHVTRAAQSLNLTQSAVSAAIAALENRHAVKLFSRVGRRIELTESGRIFLSEARAVLARTQTAELALSELSGLARGALTIHASQTIASYWLPRYLVQFHLTYPKIKINLVAGNTTQVARAVDLGTADLGFVEGRVEEENLVQQAVARDRLILVVGRKHPWAARKRVMPNDLLSTGWVLREVGSGTRSEFEDALREWKIAADRLNVVLELPSNEAVRAAVESGAGATVISEFVAAAGLKTGSLKSIALPLPQRAYTALRHRERYFSKAAQAFLDEIKGKKEIAKAS
ncbi:MAG TPA: LysR substrate-binding domain-containing protein [Xanthobacteraceae bacterium]|nr:LysR substrate-binding domain-containing protein [Xanthobacteraceae bacterium]